MDQLGSVWGAVLTATDVPPFPSVAPAARVFRGAALAVHPMFWPCPRLGPSPNVTLQVGFLGSSLRAVDPTRRSCPRPEAEPNRRYFMWTLKVKNFYLLDIKFWALSCEPGGVLGQEKCLRSHAQVLRNFYYLTKFVNP